MSLHTFFTLDLPPLLTAVFASLACALLGNYLLLRRLSLMGDAISHSVLPGLIAGFILTGSRATLPMFLGAAAAGITAVVLIELVRRLGRVEPGAAMGVIFSVLFALGVVLVSVYAREIDLDPDCVLNGILETIIWPDAPSAWSGLFAFDALATIPRQVPTTFAIAAIAILFIAAFYKELRITAFDPALATALGINAGAMHLALMVLVAAAVVASFEAVGSILVVAMLIVPGATARLLTDRLGTQVLLSAVIAAATAVLGYLAGAHAPVWLGADNALSAAGMMTVVGGLLLGAAFVFAPAHGILARAIRRTGLAITIAREDLLAMLYRVEESTGQHPAALPERHAFAALAPSGRAVPRMALRAALRHNLVARTAEGLVLTPAGRDAARHLIRTHRLWETYLVHQLGLRPDHVHRTAMDLEHLTSSSMHTELTAGPTPHLDPQGKPIP